MKNLNFSVALEALKKGKRVRRNGWNGNNMFLIYIDPYSNDQYSVVEKPFMIGTLCPYVGLKTSDNKIVAWVCSQNDLLSEDWEILGQMIHE